ncbi:MAG: DNA polymerase I [Thermoguttaceae bacterium]|nr:DNA polymerase I [Thermoguttaceae bacterium]
MSEPTELSPATAAAAGPLSGKTAVVLDVYGVLYQVFHTMREMSGPKGQPTGAAFGLVRDTMNLLTRFRPDYFYCALDRPGDTFRHKIDPQYKANRPPMPDDLRPQTLFARYLLDALGVVRLEIDNYEADDILATMAQKITDAGGKAILVTSDKDARQLIAPGVTLYNLRKEALYAEAELLADWGIRPDQVVDYQTLVGDSADNVPGVPLIGPKSATALLQQYDTLENLYEHIDELKGKKKENLLVGRAQTAITRSLVTLHRSVPVTIDWEADRYRGVDDDRLRTIFDALGFRSLMPKISPLAEELGSAAARLPLPEDFAGATGERDQIAASTDTAAGSEKTLPIVPQRTEEPSHEPSPVTERLFAAITPPESPTVIFDRFPTTDAFGAGRLEPEKIDYRLVDTPEAFDEFFQLLSKAPVFSFDLETIDIEGSKLVRPRFALPVGIAICFEAGRAWYLPLRGPLGSDLLDEKTTLAALKPVFESPTILKLGQNIKFDKIVLGNIGIEVRGIFFDTMVADYLLFAGQRRHNLDELALRYLEYKTIPISDLIGVGKKQIAMDQVPTDLVARYAGEDALVPWRLYPLLLAELKKIPALERLLKEVEIPLIDVLCTMETNGIKIDPEHFREMGKQFAAQLEAIEESIRQMASQADPDPDFARTFNINSPQQLQRLLFDDLKLPVQKKTKTGKSTDIEVLEQLALYHPLPEKLIEHRGVVKLKGTYVDPIPELVHPKTGRIHASFNQVVTATGRLSSSDPNLQNIPVRSEEGKKIRAGFIPDPTLGFDRLISCDYSQIELRVLTHFSGDKRLKEAFDNDLDIHAHVASELFGVPIGEVRSDQRRIAKTVNFGLIYGQSAFGLAKVLKTVSRGEAGEYIRKFFATYPGIRTFLDSVLDQCRRHGFVETVLGRRRYIEGVRGARGDGQLNMAERTAINTVIQGSAADIMKLAMINVDRRLKSSGSKSGQPTLFDEGGYSGRLLLQIHDELILETTAQEAPRLAEMVRREMELGQPLSVPLKIDTEITDRWGGDAV